MALDYKARVRAALEGYQAKLQRELYPTPKKRAATNGEAIQRATVPLERDEQRALTKYLNGMGVLWFHPVNEAKRSLRLAARLRAQGMKAGVPDVLIFTPCSVDGHSYAGVAVELKRQKGGKVSDTQDTWLQNLRACGWLAFVALGADDAIARLSKCKFAAR